MLCYVMLCYVMLCFYTEDWSWYSSTLVTYKRIISPSYLWNFSCYVRINDLIDSLHYLFTKYDSVNDTIVKMWSRGILILGGILIVTCKHPREYIPQTYSLFIYKIHLTFDVFTDRSTTWLLRHPCTCWWEWYPLLQWLSRGSHSCWPIMIESFSQFKYIIADSPWCATLISK